MTADRYTLGITDEPTKYDGEYADGSPFPWPAERIGEYTALRIDTPVTVDGRLDEPVWQKAPRSARHACLRSVGSR